MSYDAERYQVKQIYPMVKATFAGALKGTTATNTNSQTSAIMSDRIEFFNNIKLTAMRCQSEIAPDALAHATSQTVKIAITDGATAYARASLGTVLGVMATGSIITANIPAGTSLEAVMQVTGWDGTVQTMQPGSVYVYLEYQNRF